MLADTWHRNSHSGSRSDWSIQSIEDWDRSSSSVRIRLFHYGHGLWSVSCCLLYSRKHGEQAFNTGSGYGLEVGPSGWHGILGRWRNTWHNLPDCHDYLRIWFLRDGRAEYSYDGFFSNFLVGRLGTAELQYRNWNRRRGSLNLQFKCSDPYSHLLLCLASADNLGSNLGHCSDIGRCLRLDNGRHATQVL